MVRPLCGRDQGGIQTVLRIEDGYALIADGKRRPLERPKRKNPRHIAVTGDTLDEQAMATNRALRRALAGIGEQRRPDETTADRDRPAAIRRPPTT